MLPKVLVITSPGLKEGKSTICANLGVVLAQVGKNTLVMDCDLRKPAMHKIFGIRNFYGVVDALAGEEMPEGGWPEAVPGLKVATAGLMPTNPAELLSSKRFADLLGGVREKFDYVLIDAPPVGGPFSDSSILAVQADGVLLVFDSQNTRRRSLREAVRNLSSVGARILGMVMNNVKA
jgi:capsular exopolysaccharide synthesis family protein